MVTASDRKAVENLTVTNMVLTDEPVTSNDKLVTALLKITQLTDQLLFLKTGKGQVTSDAKARLYYCHSCGYD